MAESVEAGNREGFEPCFHIRYPQLMHLMPANRPRKAAYNRIYSRTTRGCLVVVVFWAALAMAGFTLAAVLVSSEGKTMPRNIRRTGKRIRAKTGLIEVGLDHQLADLALPKALLLAVEERREPA